ncbi:hypothetical protein PR048_004056 [Dryococelus australis]|uniref:FHA domain-containing protein n=1 Tax=Dryococelus australis TaxID=614101 RepID=A0ABQ9I4E5_9NEOP|nr:hypothetical protein PR048_004056 [Dryococelus australis]
MRETEKSALYDIFETSLGSITVTLNQDNFLANRNRKSRCKIAMLKRKFEQEHFITFQASSDTDAVIVKTAIRMSLEKTSVIVGEDIDLVVLLVDMAPTSECIFFMETEIYSSESMSKLSECKKHILYLHTMTGFDTTSALFSKGNIKAVQLLNKRPDSRTSASMFKEPNTPKDVVERYALHGATISEISLDEYHFKCFTRSVGRGRVNNLALQHQAKSAAREHSFMVYHQVQKWSIPSGCTTKCRNGAFVHGIPPSVEMEYSFMVYHQV